MRIISALSICCSAVICLSCNSSATTETKHTEKQTGPTAETTPAIEGAWELVWAKYNDTIQTVSKRPMFKMFHQGVFSLFARDSAGRISFAGFGDYELSGDHVYKETFRYHTHAPFTGAMDWQEYEMKEDTLYFKGFNKVVIGGKDVTKGFRKIEEKRVKVKWPAE